jgi:hypothetical protein
MISKLHLDKLIDMIHYKGSKSLMQPVVVQLTIQFFISSSVQAAVGS